MPTDKEIKAEFRLKTAGEPDKYYATSVLKSEGFSRGRCTKCGKNFWSIQKKDVCGDPACSGGFRFINDTPAKHKMDYIGVWQKFSEHFRKRGYTPIQRYPVAARWRDDTDFVQASIYDFQPYVVSGEVSPPANPLVVPQFCLRFNDVDNVGITGSHYTGFVMIGQHAFMPPEKWNQVQYFEDIHSWLKLGLGIPNEELTFHEDAWAGGGNFGPCMEYFSRGLELGNQVYMQYEITPSGPKELKLKVLDMGMGQERNAWFTMGKATSYESTFPTVTQKLYQLTGIKPDKDLIQKFLPYASYLNADETDDINAVWADIAGKLKVKQDVLKQSIIPLSALYSVAEHSRTLLVALTDGALPSNVAGGYNLRMILRRALNFIQKYNWDIDLVEVCAWHADYLKPQFLELMANLKEVAEIIEIEKRKYADTQKKSRQVLAGLLAKGLDEDRLAELYDSQGIGPEMVKEEADKQGITVKIPDNFYSLVADRHEQKEQQAQTHKKEKLDIHAPDTEALYFEDYQKLQFKAKVLAVLGKNVVLDRTAFYPTSGGQLHDVGKLGGINVVDVFKQGAMIIHVLEHESLKVGDEVDGQIDHERRKQLAQHHTATHIINGVCRKILGNHIWQAGAAKFLDRARLDITHYEQLTKEQLEQIEEAANEIVVRNLPVHSYFMPRDEAEKKYGFILYQGGAVPGKRLRIVETEGLDVEACGGTHCKTTGEVGRIHITKSSKIHDGIIRLEYTAGQAAKETGKEQDALVKELAGVLGCSPVQIPGRAEELFGKWKDCVKKGKAVEKTLSSTAAFEGDIIKKTAEIFKTQPEHLLKTAKRFIEELAAA